MELILAAFFCDCDLPRPPLVVLRISCLLLLSSSGIFSDASDDIFNSPGPDDVPALIKYFEDPNLRFGASKAIASLGPNAVPHLIDGLQSDQQDSRIWSAYTLGRIGPSAMAAAPVLAELLPSSDVTLKRVVARSLGQIQADGSPIVTALAKMTTDDDVRVRQRAVVSLGQIGPAAHAAAGQLVDALQDQRVRASALQSLCQIGTDAIPSLTNALNDDRVRLEVAEALRCIDLETAKHLGVGQPGIADLAALELSLHNQEKDLPARASAARQLGSLGIEAAPILIAAFEDSHRDVTAAVAAAFAEIGPSAVPMLRESLQHPSPRVRVTALNALAAIGSRASDASGELAEALADKDRDVRHHAVRCVRSIGAAPDLVVVGLIEVMQNPRQLEATRQLAIKTLAEIAPKQEKTIAAFHASAEDRNYGVSSLAKEMLKRLEPDE